MTSSSSINEASPGREQPLDASNHTNYHLKFALNVPYADVARLLHSNARLQYSLRDCSRAGRVTWKLRLNRSGEAGPDDAGVAAYLRFEPQTRAESVRCRAEFALRVAGPGGRILERRSPGQKEFSRREPCHGWADFATGSELADLATRSQAEAGNGGGVDHLKLSGQIRVCDSSRLLYPRRRHSFARQGGGSDFRLKVALATFHVHRAVLALNSDHFAGLFAAPDCLESRTGQAVLSGVRIQDVHLMLQLMYPGYPEDVLDDASLLPLSRLASRYRVHTLSWRCMHYIDTRLEEAELLTADLVMLYYSACLRWLQCRDLAEQCARVAADMPWREVKSAGHFKELAEAEKAAFLQAYLDFKELAAVAEATTLEVATRAEATTTTASTMPMATGLAASSLQDGGEESSDTGLPAEEEDEEEEEEDQEDSGALSARDFSDP